MKRTNSGFVVIQAGFFRDKQTKNLYGVKAGYYPIEECVADLNGNKRLIMPDSAVVLIPRLPNTSVLKY
jgi:hypothetical protein